MVHVSFCVRGFSRYVLRSGITGVELHVVAIFLAFKGTPVLFSTVAVPVTSCCCSVAKSCPTLYDSIHYSTPGFPVLYLLKLMSIESVMPSNHLILCHLLLILPSVFPSIRVFSIELVLCIRWSKYWSFSLSIHP